MFCNAIGLLTYSISISAFVLFSLFLTVTKAQDNTHPTSHLPVPHSHLTGEERDQAVNIGTRELRVATVSLPSRSSSAAIVRCSTDDMGYGYCRFDFMGHSQEISKISRIIGTEEPGAGLGALGTGESFDELINVLSSVESVSDNNPNSRLAIVTIYNYKRDETIRRLVDLVQSKVVEEKVIEGSRAPLADVEKKVAEWLVLTDPRIAEFLGPDLHDVKVGMLLTTTQNPQDEFYRQRVVLTTFKTSRGYPQNLPKIFVNLTNSSVIVRK